MPKSLGCLLGERSMRSCIFLRLSLWGAVTLQVSAYGGAPCGGPDAIRAVLNHPSRPPAQGDHKGRPYIIILRMRSSFFESFIL